MTSNKSYLHIALATALSAAFAGSVYAAELDGTRLVNSDKEPGNWMSYHGSYKSWHYSSLDQITTKNVGKLTEAWSYVAWRAFAACKAIRWRSMASCITAARTTRSMHWTAPQAR